MKIPELLAKAGCKKLTFTGGEPTLCPYLGDLLEEAKRIGLTTMVVSNGTGITSKFLQVNQENIDWVGLSVDSVLEDTEVRMGRGAGRHIRSVVHLCRLLEQTKIHLKINTVVTAFNWKEDMRVLLEVLQPERWKIFQVLAVDGQNNGSVDPLLISSKQFQMFVDRHGDYNPIVETNEVMRGSYVMLDPLGRFFQNSTGKHVYSQSILEASVLEALNQVGWDQLKFLDRGGIYNW